jgi:hypothetical protein
MPVTPPLVSAGCVVALLPVALALDPVVPPLSEPVPSAPLSALPSSPPQAIESAARQRTDDHERRLRIIMAITEGATLRRRGGLGHLRSDVGGREVYPVHIEVSNVQVA